MLNCGLDVDEEHDVDCKEDKKPKVGVCGVTVFGAKEPELIVIAALAATLTCVVTSEKAA